MSLTESLLQRAWARFAGQTFWRYNVLLPMQHATLVQTGVRWLRQKCSVVLYEFSVVRGESPDVIGWGSGAGSCLIECKLTRADFLRDAQKKTRKKPGEGMGHRRYYMSPPEVIGVQDLPPKWGLLWVSGRQVTVMREAKGHAKRNLAAEVQFLARMLRRAQIRIGSRPLSEWLRGENQFEAKRGIPPNRGAAALHEARTRNGHPAKARSAGSGSA